MVGVTVRARYLGTIAAELGRGEEEFSFPGPVSVGSLILRIVKQHGQARESVFCSRDGRALALAVLNGRSVGRDQILAGGDTVSFVPMVSGG